MSIVTATHDAASAAHSRCAITTAGGMSTVGKGEGWGHPQGRGRTIEYCPVSSDSSCSKRDSISSGNSATHASDAKSQQLPSAPWHERGGEVRARCRRDTGEMRARCTGDHLQEVVGCDAIEQAAPALAAPALVFHQAIGSHPAVHSLSRLPPLRAAQAAQEDTGGDRRMQEETGGCRRRQEDAGGSRV